MKGCFCFLAFIAIVNAAPLPTTRYHSSCREGLNLEDEVLEQAHKGQFGEDSHLRKYLLCLSQKIGYLDSDGNIKKDVLNVKLKGLIGDSSLANNLAEQCSKKTDSIEKTAFNLVKCYYENTPSHIFIANEVFLTPVIVDQLITSHKTCLAETKVDPKLIDLAHKRGQFTEDPKFKKYLLCFSKNLKFQTDNGKLQNHVMQEYLSNVLSDKNMANKFVEVCAVTKKTAEDTAFNTLKCYYNIPAHIAMLPSTKKEKN